MTGSYAGLSLHAGVASEAHEHEKLERLCRYITRPALWTERLSLTAQANVRYRLVAPAHPCARDIRASLHIKTPYRDGTTDVVFAPLELMAHLGARHPSGDLRSSKSAILPICHGSAGRLGANAESQPHAIPRGHIDDLARQIIDCVSR